MPLLTLIFSSATFLLVAFTLLPLWRHESWWVRSLDFPRLQLLVLSTCMFAFGIALLDLKLPLVRGLLFLLLFCIVYHSWWILPYTGFYRPEVLSAVRPDSRRTIRVMTANVLTPNRNAEDLIDLVKENDPHVLVTLESDAWWQERLDSLEPDYPYTVKCPLDNLYGMHVYSKLPLENSQVDYLVEPDIPSIHARVVLPSGEKVRAHFLHPAPPSPTENEESAERDAELVIVAKSLAETNEPAIVAGDLNDVAWSETTRLFRKISGMLDPRIGRGMFNTYHADYWFMRWPLDHLFHSRHFTLSEMRRLRGFGSDHFALFIELVFDPGRNGEKNGLAADSDDMAWAEAKAEDQAVDKDDVPRP